MYYYNQYDAFIGDGRAGAEAPSCDRGVHVRTCRCTPHLTCASLSSNGSLAAHQVQTQSAQPFARYGKRVCTCERTDATHPDLCKARIYWAPSHTQNLNAVFPAVCEIWKRDVHVRTRRCTPPQTCGKHLPNGYLVTHQNLNAIRRAVCEMWKTGVQVRTCRCTPPQTCRKHLSNGPLVTHKI